MRLNKNPQPHVAFFHRWTDLRFRCPGRLQLALLLLFCLLNGVAELQAATRNSRNIAPVVSPVNNGNFEAPPLAPNQFVQRPANAGWSFFLNSGISRNGSGFTAGNPGAPQGNQVLYLQIQGRVSRPIQLSPGTYRLRLRAAQRANHQATEQTFAVRVGGEEVARIRPTNTSYGTYYTAAFRVSTGNETLELEGLNPNGGDNTAFVDDIQAEKLMAWSDPGSWVGGVLPGVNDSVTIVPNAAMILDVNANIGVILIRGKLYAAANRDLNFSAKRIMVMGPGSQLEWGKADAPYLRRGIITLKGSNPNDSILDTGTKFLAAMMQGQVDVHGAPGTSWTQLNQTANVGNNFIRLKEPVTWKAGDQIVIASTDFDPHQAETFTINSVTENGRRLNLNGNLQYMHFGQLQNYSNADRSFVLDERAEVGLLSHNITIQGDASSTSNGFGGHTMFMQSAQVRISGVEFFRMGQRGRIARYPFHWHIAGNVPGQYIKNSSIHRSFNRILTVHATNDALIEDVVGYDHVGHGFFMESGNERRNTFRHNLGILTRLPSLPKEKLTPHDSLISDQRDLVKLPATFWITHPDNNYIDNAAAGSEGSGFWMTAQSQSIAPAPPLGRSPATYPLGIHDGNRGHSNSFSNFSIDGNIDRTSQEFGFGRYRPQDPPGVQSFPWVKRFTGFKARERNIWVRGNTMFFDSCALADTPRNTFFANNQILLNSLVVGKSDNIGNPVSNQEVNFAGRSLGLPDTDWLDQWNIFSGHTIYDGPSGIYKVHFAGFDGKNSQGIRISAAATKSTVHWALKTTWEAGIEDSNRVEFGTSSNAETMYSSGLQDMDGTITGVTNGMITPLILPHPFQPRIHESGFNHFPNATLKPHWNAWINDNERFGLVILKNGWPKGTSTPTYNIRQQGSTSFATYGAQLSRHHNQNPVILNDLSYEYHWQYHKIPYAINASLNFAVAGNYMISVFPNMPSTTRVYDRYGNPLAQASTLWALKNGNTQRYYFRNNTLYLKHIARPATASYEWQYGGRLTDQSDSIKVCQRVNCDDREARTDGVTLADFEMGPDSRVFPGRSGNLPLPSLVYSTNNPNSGPFDATDDDVRWTMTGDGDGNNEYTQIRLDFPRQVWNEFRYLELDYSGPAFQVYVLDKSQNFRYFGEHTPPSNGKTVIALNPATNGAYLDEVVRLIIRVRESSLGALTSTPSRTIRVRDIKLYMSNPAPKVSKQALPELAETVADPQLVLAPNPSAGEFTLSMALSQDDVLTTALYDLQGRQVFQATSDATSGKWQEKFDAGNLPRGVYKVVVRTVTHGIHTQNLVLH